MSTWKCTRCGHEWEASPPASCPICKDVYEAGEEVRPWKTPRLLTSTEDEMVVEVMTRIGFDGEDPEGLLKNLVGRVRMLERDRCAMIVAENKSATETLDGILRPSTVSPRRERDSTAHDAKDIVPEIVEWLMGLESARESVVAGSMDPREVAVMQARRGVYEGVADDIKRKWGTR